MTDRRSEFNHQPGSSRQGSANQNYLSAQSGQPGQPATPRMLRSISGSLKNSRNDLNVESSPTPRAEEWGRSHSRNASFHQQQQQQQQQQQTFDPNVMTPQTPMHRRVPSNNPLPNVNPVTPRQLSNPIQIPNQIPNQIPPASMNPKIINQHMGSNGMESGMSSSGMHGHPQGQGQAQSSNQNHHGFPSPQPSQQHIPPHVPPVSISNVSQGQPTQGVNGELLPPVAISTNMENNSTMDSKMSKKPSKPSSSKHGQGNTGGNGGGNGQQPFHRKSIGDWDFIKTIGAGSMGKVKLAQHNSTGEICAVKIVPRAAKLYQREHANDPPPSNEQEARQRQKDFEKELARDKRTTREGALGRLLFHPYICRLYEIVPMTNHYYMLFEYVEGGQMLDYIVAHGSLKEKHARKFARGIASALDYCHRNNVVHRDLKIENIMINQKGDVKIIDFGLSNLYSPKSLLKTYCGSLYFAAPELLSAKPYIGPEVDVWSFGVVLYVLVCGKVPFDDQSVSVLHEKIKKANVEYPAFLSKECISLLTRMLHVDPTKRATLFEVMNHPWMNKGFEYSISSHIPKRLPLTLPLNPEIIKTISSFDLGNSHTITEELNNLVGSVEYQMSSENWYRVIESGRDYGSASNSHILPDPTGGFHPLISIYYLVDEMKKRKKAKEELVKAQLEQVEKKQEEERLRQAELSAQGELQLQQQQLQAQQLQLQSQSQAPQQAQQSISQNSNVAPQDDNMEMDDNTVVGQAEPMVIERKEVPQISFPEKAYHSSNYQTTEPTDANNEPIPNQQSPSPTETLDPKHLNSIFRRLSKKEELPKKDPMVRRGVSMKITAKERSDSRIDNNLPTAAGSNLNNNNNNSGVAINNNNNTSGINAKVMVNKRSHNRSSSINTPNKHGFVPVEYLPPLPNIDSETNQVIPNKSISGRKLHPTARSKSLGGSIKRDISGRKPPPLPNQHIPGQQNSDEQIESKSSGAAGSNNNNNNNSDAVYDGYFDDILLDDEEIEHSNLPQLTEEQIIEQFNNAKPNSMPSIEYPKTLFLKGFFSVQTTSTKPLPVIRYNIINVLSRLGVKFQEVKGGFVCSHTPSLQNPENDGGDDEQDKLYGDAFNVDKSEVEIISGYSGTPPSNGNGMIIGQSGTPAAQGTGGNGTGNISPSVSTSPVVSSRTPSRQPSLQLTNRHRPSNSISSISSNLSGHRRKFSIGGSILRRKEGSLNALMPPNTPAAARINKSLYGEEFDDELLDKDYYEELKLYDDDSVDSVGNLMIGGGSDMLSSRIDHKKSSKIKKSPLKFEIHVVKFPLVGLYGVQFKKLLGNTWNYKTLASQILGELKL